MQDELSEIEIEKIENIFVKDEVLFEAVKKVLLKSIYTSGVLKAGKKHNPLMNAAFGLAGLSTENPIPNEQIGQQVRALWEGVNALEIGYKALKNIKSTKGEAVVSPYNEAE